MGLALDLLIGHMLGDFLLQPGSLVLAKRSRVSALLLHTGIVGAAMALVVWDRLDEYWPAVLLATIAHLLVEPLTISTYERTRTRGLFTFMLDQALHVLSIVVAVVLTGAWAMEPQASAFGFGLRTTALAAWTGVLLVSLFGSILVFEAVNAVAPQGAGKGEVLRFDAARIAGMLERASAFGLTLWHPALIWIPFVPRVVVAIRGGTAVRARQSLAAAAGLALCLFAYVATGIVILVIGGVQ
jgi:hypothetical protein